MKAHEATTALAIARQRSERRPRSPRLSVLLWSCLLVVVPLVVGVLINIGFGWWLGLAAFLVAAVLTGSAAHRSGPGGRLR
jgi:hypothetical protein